MTVEKLRRAADLAVELDQALGELADAGIRLRRPMALRVLAADARTLAGRLDPDPETDPG